ncbi:DMT family transporter [Falsiroseomonas sp. E2-1-a4]|uniref:DMT family transporter n=1 Tax=Falsiroseomonas sp. E2-1-a4 TaxID=3239299 RepID=UPI003F2BBCE9
MRGPVLMLAGIGLFGLLDANSKLLSDGHEVWQVLLVRFATLLLVVLCARALIPGWGGVLSTRFPRLHAARALVMLGSAICFFQAFSLLPLAEGYLVFFTSPFLVLALSAWLLQERPPAVAWAWCAVGFAGVAIGLAPGLAGMAGGAPVLGYLYALGGTFCYSAVFVLNRQLRTEPGIGRVLIWPSVLGFAVMLPLGLSHWSTPTALSLAQMVGNGLIVGAATVCLAEAFRHATASRLAPFGYSGLVWSLTWDFAFWGRIPVLAMLAGAAVVVFACIMSERAAARR